MSGALLHMTPSLSSQDAVNLRLPHAKALGDLMLAKCSGERAYFYNLFFGELRASMLRAFARYVQTICVSVESVFGSRHPFKIFDAIVQLVTINVVDFMAGRWRWANECLRNQSVHKPLNLSAGQTDSGPEISATSNAKPKYALRQQITDFPAPSVRSPGDDPLYRSDPPQIRNLVRSFESHNRFPNLVHFRPCADNTLARNTINSLTQGEIL